MTYLEIIEWIQGNLLGMYYESSDKIALDYYDSEGIVATHEGKDLVSIVLEINDKQLIK